MDWYIVCFVDKEGALCGLQSAEKAKTLPLHIHLNKCMGMNMSAVLGIELCGSTAFCFEDSLYQAVAVDNKSGWGTLVFISEAPIRAKLYENILNQLNLGLQIFDNRGHLLFLNETCKHVESLIEQNVLHRHLREIYAVDEEYSTMLNTIKLRKPIKNRCDIFKNRFGDKVISLNTGYPLYVDDYFFGALGVVMDPTVLAEYTAQWEILDRYIKQSRGKTVSGYHMNRYYTFEDIIGTSKAMRDAVGLAQKAAASEFSVLLLGETGTGKEMFAQSLHSASPRHKKNFVAINCAAIPSSILESTLFGTVKGSFTGSGNQNGLLDEANGGTLFLDEINSMDIQVQSKLLRVLQEKNFRRVGGLKDISCDMRIIAAMNESPESAIVHNRLRNDLYYRLNTITVEIPPLRERPEDIPLLVSHYLKKSACAAARNGEKVTVPAMAVLEQYDWPGNIRELFHTLDYAMVIAEGEPIDIACFPQRFALKPEQEGEQCKNYLHYDLRKRLLETEKQMLKEALQEHGGNISHTARALNLSRQNLQHRLKKCGVEQPNE